MLNLEFIIHGNSCRTKPSSSQIEQIHDLARTLRSQQGFIITISQASAQSRSCSSTGIHWIVGPNMPEIRRTRDSKAVIVNLNPLLPIAGMPALTMPTTSISQSLHPFHNESPWLLSEYRSRLHDGIYRPLPKRYDRLFRNTKHPVILLIKEPADTDLRLRAFSGSAVSSHDIGSRAIHAQQRWRDASVLTVDGRKTPSYLLAALVARATLVVGIPSSTLTTAALLGSPTLPLANKNDSLGSNFDWDTGDTISDLIEKGKANSLRLVNELAAAWPLPEQKETHPDTFLNTILPLATPALGYSSAVNRPIKSMDRLAPCLSSFPRTEQPPPTCNHAVTSKYLLITDQLRRKMRKLRNDPLAFICDAKGSVPAAICRCWRMRQADTP